MVISTAGTCKLSILISILTYQTMFLKLQNKMERGGACINVNTNILIVLSFHEQILAGSPKSVACSC